MFVSRGRARDITWRKWHVTLPSRSELPCAWGQEVVFQLFQQKRRVSRQNSNSEHLGSLQRKYLPWFAAVHRSGYLGHLGFKPLGSVLCFASDSDSMNFCFLRNSEVVGLVLWEVKRPFGVPWKVRLFLMSSIREQVASNIARKESARQHASTVSWCREWRPKIFIWLHFSTRTNDNFDRQR